MEDFFNSRSSELLNFISNHGVVWIYCFMFISAIVENLFPPYPGDTVTFMGGYLASSGALSLPLAFFFTCTGSLVGALILYYLGAIKGRHLFEKDKGRILNKSQLAKIEKWFGKYGSEVIIASRFVTGVRSGIAVAAGLGKIRLWKMTVYSLISILAWNGIIIGLGTLTRQNQREIFKFLSLYNRFIFVILILVLVIWLIRLRQRRAKKNNSWMGK
ncbi:MAG TPA: DedA family protein [Terriglobales bacterium]|nr:DedA family protein [Terriglobales bacterium]